MERRQAFATLGLRPGAPLREIRRSYLALARRWHPDLHDRDPLRRSTAEERFKEIAAAYRLLCGGLHQSPPRRPSEMAPVSSAGRRRIDSLVIWGHILLAMGVLFSLRSLFLRHGAFPGVGITLQASFLLALCLAIVCVTRLGVVRQLRLAYLLVAACCSGLALFDVVVSEQVGRPMSLLPGDAVIDAPPPVGGGWYRGGAGEDAIPFPSGLGEVRRHTAGPMAPRPPAMPIAPEAPAAPFPPTTMNPLR